MPGAVMRSDRQRWQDERDQALRDIVDLGQQAADGEIPADTAARLRARYEAAAAGALAALESLGDEPAAPAAAVPAAAPGRSRARIALYAAAAAVAVLAVTVVLPRAIGARPAGGLVSGNAAAQQGAAQQTSLAGGYLASGRYDLALRHYQAALQQDPGYSEAQAGLGLLLFKAGEPRLALTLAGKALAASPGLLDALWLKANIELTGLHDPAAALAVLDQLRQRPDLPPSLQKQVAVLTRHARAQQAGSR